MPPAPPSVPAPAHRAEQARGATVRRRLKTVPAVLLAWLLVTVLLPLLVLVGAAVDAVRALRGGPSLVALRLLAFAWVWLTAEAFGVIALGAIWVASGGGRSRERLLDATYAVQARWTAVLWAAVRRLFALDLQVEGADAPAPGPVIVLIRHASLIDNLIPASLIVRPHGLRLRYVLKRELLGDPCLDIAGSRLPNFFVARESGGDHREVAGVRALAAGLGPHDGLLIYPEGTRFSPERLQRATARLHEAGLDDLATRSARLQHLLPPRLGGPLALLDAAPDADVVIVAHHGLDGFSHLHHIWAGGLTGATISVRMTRHARATLPATREARIGWLYDRWAEMDAWIAERRAAPEPS